MWTKSLTNTWDNIAFERLKTAYEREFGLTNVHSKPKIKFLALPGIILITNFCLSAKFDTSAGGFQTFRCKMTFFARMTVPIIYPELRSYPGISEAHDEENLSRSAYCLGGHVYAHSDCIQAGIGSNKDPADAR